VLAIQPILVFALVLGLRAAFTIPSELKAAWLFRLVAGGEVEGRRYQSGVRRASVACFVVPALTLLLPIHAMLWGAHVALLHFVFGVLWAMVLVEATFLALAKLPFTCPHVPGAARLKFLWPAYLAAFIAYTYGFARVEYEAIRANACVPLVGTLAGTYVAVVIYRRLRTRRPRPFVFYEAPDAAVTTLGL
jgi:hypothetical protein